MGGLPYLKRISGGGMVGTLRGIGRREGAETYIGMLKTKHCKKLQQQQKE